MPDPIQSSSTLDASRYYDEEQAVCLAPIPKQGETRPAAVENEAAVAQLVKSSPERSCFFPVAGAALACGGSLLGAVVGAGTGPGELAVVAIGGATCGLKVMDALECLDR